MFIVLEGLDGSGGTTQLRFLAAALAKVTNREIICTAEPSSGPIGKLIRTSLVERTFGEGVLPYLFCADRRDHLDRVINPALARGAIVISDRYLLSSLAYQAAVLPVERVHELNRDFRSPDATLLIHVPVDECLHRIERRGLTRELFETRERLVVIEDAYQKAIALRKDTDHIIDIDGQGDPVEVHERIQEALERRGLWPAS